MPLNGFPSIKKFNIKNVKIKLYTLIRHMLLTLTYIVNRVFLLYLLNFSVKLCTHVDHGAKLCVESACVDAVGSAPLLPPI